MHKVMSLSLTHYGYTQWARRKAICTCVPMTHVGVSNRKMNFVAKLTVNFSVLVVTLKLYSETKRPPHRNPVQVRGNWAIAKGR